MGKDFSFSLSQAKAAEAVKKVTAAISALYYERRREEIYHPLEAQSLDLDWSKGRRRGIRRRNSLANITLKDQPLSAWG